MRRVVLWVGVCMAGIGPASASAQDVSRPGPRPVIDFDREVALARSAAPAEVSGDATIWIWSGDTYVVGVEGTSGVACYVSRSWPESLEPHCFDEEGARTILPIHMLEVQRSHEGLGEAEIAAEVARGIERGELHLPSRPAMSYMMSADQRLISDDGRAVGAWEPHVMLYYPNLTPEALGLGGEPSTAAAVVTEPGTPFSSVMILVRDFVPVEGGGVSRDR